mmetsp:Transcript_6262/g.24402  ORF Transcript_6262/g.24402 Transcript_6262/m.24402 type:complete len:284 (+) Transcript_6262:1191-2042(+)
MRAAKVRQRIAPQKLQVPDLENILENLDGVWAGCPMHGVDAEREFGMLSEKVADRGVVELLLEHVDVVFRGIDDMDLHGTEIEGARSREVDLRSVFHDADRLDGLGFLVDAIRRGLRGGGAILVVELDAKVLVGTARIMRCSEDNAAIGLPLPDDRGHSRRGEQPSLPDVDLPHPVRRANAQDLRNRRLRKVPTVATEDEGFRRSFLPSIEHGLHEVRQEVTFLPNPYFLAQATGPRLLAFDGNSRHGDSTRTWLGFDFCFCLYLCLCLLSCLGSSRNAFGGL